MALGRAKVVDGERLVFTVDEISDFFDRAEREYGQDTTEDFVRHQLRILVRFENESRLDMAFLDVDFPATYNLSTTSLNAPFDALSVELIHHHALKRRKVVLVREVLFDLLFASLHKSLEMLLVYENIIWRDANLT